MALDGVVLNNIKTELSEKLIGARVDKIHQPEKDELVINVRNNSESYKLLLTSNSSSPRIHITNNIRKNPDQPPMFCMLLRKNLYGAFIREIKQLEFDRIIEIVFECKDELKSTINKSIIIEIMGKHSNIMLVNTESRIIIDCIKRVSENMSSKRQVYPGILYQLAPTQDKANPVTMLKDDFIALLNNSNNGIRVYDFLYKKISGFSPLLSKSICFDANINESKSIAELNDTELEQLWNSYDRVITDIKNHNYTPTIYSDAETGIYDFHSIKLNCLNNCETEKFSTISSLLDKFYYELDNKNRINQKMSSLLKSIHTKLDRDKKKLAKQRNELLTAEDRQKYKIYGDLIIANMHITPENNKLKVINYYDIDQKEIIIPLDPKNSNLSQNAQKYYKRYNKLKTAEEELKKFIEATEEDVKYLENILFSIEECKTVDDLDDIYEELIQAGFMKKRKAYKSNIKKKQEILTYLTSKGHEILVGKNNIQNDLITFKYGKRDDYWFHAKGIPGSHVLIKTNGDELDDQEYIEAAKLAAYYSKGRNNSLVEIDYTKKINIKKPANAKLGFVIYDTNYSLNTKPDISNIKIKSE